MIRQVLLVLALLVGATTTTVADDYTTSTRARNAALEALFAKAGETRPIARLSFQPKVVSMVTKGDAEPFVAWQVKLLDLRILSLDMVAGPDPTPEFSIVDDRNSAFFSLRDIDLGGFDEAVRKAVAFAQLRAAPTVSNIEISRRVSLLPTPSYGEVRWTIILVAPGESATVYEDAQGNVIGADLPDTERVRSVNFLTSDEWPMAEAQEQLGNVVGSALVHEVRIDDRSVYLEVDHPTDKTLVRDYTWRVGGITRGLVDMPNFATMGLGDIAPFPMAELDLTVLPAVKAAALAAFDSEGARITGIEADKPTNRAASGLEVLWDVDLRQANAETGNVLVDMDGKVVEVGLPESRLAEARPWLAPETVASTLGRIAEAFGPEAKIFEISINDTQASLQIEDPQAPGELAQFLVDARDIERFGTASFFADLAPEHVFTMRELETLTAERIGDFADRTVAAMQLEGAEVYRYTISRQALMMDPSDTRLMIEVRAGKDQGNVGGWLTFTLDGTQTDQMLP
jgi:hypothetical protein